MSGHHSDFVKGVLSDHELASEFFALALRPEVLERIDLATLSIEDGTFVDEQNRMYYSDLLFRVELRSGAAARLYLLFEHKSHPDQSVLDQLAVYQALIYRKQGRRRKDPVLPVVFYHGEPDWSVPLEFKDQIHLNSGDLEAFASDLMNFRYTLVNVRETPIDRLEASIRQRAFWGILDRIWDLNSAAKFRDFLDSIVEFHGEIPGEFLGKLLAYILRVQDIELTLIERHLAEVLTVRDAGNIMGTLDKLEAKARLEGKLEGKLEDARNLLENGVSLEVILKSTGLTFEDLRAAGIEVDEDTP